MKSSRFLVAALGAAVVCASAIFVAGQSTVAPNEEAVFPTGTNGEISGRTLRQAQMRQALDANASLFPWLLEQIETGDEQERASAAGALYAVAPIAAPELMKGLAHPNPTIRQTAMSLLPRAAESASFPLSDAMALLLKIAEDENEDDTFRKQARMAVCQLICATQGTTIRLPSRPA